MGFDYGRNFYCWKLSAQIRTLLTIADLLASELVPTDAAIGRCALHRGDLMTDRPHRASDTPFAVNVEQGKDYWWCACGPVK